jgi:PadR family transcriptional regulator, regulatory protein PadR
MSTQDADRMPLMQGTLDLLVLRMLTLGPEHGQGIARAIQTGSQEELLVEHGSLYPALQRLEADGAIVGEWGISDNNRRARYYRLTPRGRKVLAFEITRWKRLVSAIGNIIEPAAGPKTAGEA